MVLQQPQAIAARCQKLEDSLCAWGQGRPRVRAAVLVGSRPRRDHPADAYSDLDLFTRLAQEAAEALAFPYPRERDANMLGYIRALLRNHIDERFLSHP